MAADDDADVQLFKHTRKRKSLPFSHTAETQCVLKPTPNPNPLAPQTPPDQNFRSLGLSQWLDGVCSSLGIMSPTPVQSGCIPAILQARRKIAAELLRAPLMPHAQDSDRFMFDRGATLSLLRKPAAARRRPLPCQFFSSFLKTLSESMRSCSLLQGQSNARCQLHVLACWSTETTVVHCLYFTLQGACLPACRPVPRFRSGHDIEGSTIAPCSALLAARLLNPLNILPVASSWYCR